MIRSRKDTRCRKSTRHSLHLETLENRQLMAGDLDLSFGNGFGMTTTNVGGSEDVVDVAAQTDGKIVALGTTTYGGGGTNFALARYHSDGTLDTSFGGVGVEDGMTVTDFHQTDNLAVSVAVLPDGKILAAGKTTIDGTGIVVLSRYNADGLLDATFGNDGKIDIPVLNNGEFTQMIVAENKVTLVSRDELIRLNMDGSLDTSFAADGRVQTTALGFQESTHFGSVDIENGKYVVGMKADGILVAIRLNSDGSLDTTFSDDGVSSMDFSGNNNVDVTDVVQLEDGSILGIVAFNGFELFKMDASGTPDDGFHVNGVYEGTTGLELRDLVIQPNGSVVAVGQFYGQTAAIRMLSDGTLDTSFGNDGMTVLNLGTGNFAHSVIGYANGKVLLAGQIGLPGSDFFLTRLTGNDAQPQIEGAQQLGIPIAPPSQTPIDHGNQIIIGVGDIEPHGRMIFDNAITRQDIFGRQGRPASLSSSRQRSSGVDSRGSESPTPSDAIDDFFGELNREEGLLKIHVIS